MNLMEANLRRTNTVFHGVVPGQEARSLGCITLQVAFGDVNNYRQERMTFEVVPFKSMYHVIFGHDIFHTLMESHASSITSSRYPDQTVSSPYPEALPKQWTARLEKQPLRKLS